jgi:hypothetical protein
MRLFLRTTLGFASLRAELRSAFLPPPELGSLWSDVVKKRREEQRDKERCLHPHEC